MIHRILIIVLAAVGGIVTLGAAALLGIAGALALLDVLA